MGRWDEGRGKVGGGGSGLLEVGAERSQHERK